MSLPRYQEMLLGALNGAQAMETFATGERLGDAPLPGLAVAPLGPIGLPLTPGQHKELVQHSTPAPFGQGSDTVVDPTVRDCRQVEAERVTVSPRWREFVQACARRFATALGAQQEGQELVEARLYKLVLYEEGGFFKPHKDTEKEDRMFGSLVVQLPTQHSGGQLVVRHRGEERAFDFSGEQSGAFFFGAAFYADCEHELKPVRDGSRLCLLYNLVRVGAGEVPRLAIQREGIAEELNTAAATWEQALGADRAAAKDVDGGEADAGSESASGSGEEDGDGGEGGEGSGTRAGSGREPTRLVILLEYEYTEAGLNFENLKGADLEKANLLKSCGALEVHLALIQRHKQGSGVYTGGGRRYGRRRWYAESSGDERGPGERHEIDDLHEDTIEISKWVDATDATVSFPGMELDYEKDTLDGKPLFGSDDKVDHEDYEGYTGNCGPTVDHWYNRACLVIWPSSLSLQVACAAGMDSAIALARRRLAQPGGSQDACRQTLREVWSFAKRRGADKTQKHLVTLLNMATGLADLAAALEIIERMAQGSAAPDHSLDMYSLACGQRERSVCKGCSSAARKEAISQAVQNFGWAAVESAVTALVAATPVHSVQHAASLALEALDEQAEPELKIASPALARAVTAQLVDAEFANVGAAVGPLLKLLFVCPACAPARAGFLSRIKEGGVVALRQALETVDSLKTSGAITALPEGFVQLVGDFSALALASSAHVEHAVAVFKLLLRLGDGGAMCAFAARAVEHRKPNLLQALANLCEAIAAASDPQVIALVRARADQLRYAKPEPSNRQPRASVPGHPGLTQFFRSDKTETTYQEFTGIAHARNFAAKHAGCGAGGYNSSEHTSATWTPGGTGRNAYVRVVKTGGTYEAQLRQYEADQEELKKLGKEFALGQASSADVPSSPPAKKVKR